MSRERRLRLQMVEAARHLCELGVNPGKSGNLSARVDEGFLVTPSGAPYETLHPDDIVFLGPQGEHGGGQRKPSTEWRLHRDVYLDRPRVEAVVHTHSPYATTLACLGRPIPAFHYEVAFAGGKDIRCAPYATFGTQELSDRARAAMEGRRACLMANHGALAVGATLEEAVALAEKLEVLARMYWQALQVGEPTLLDESEMTRIVARVAAYGRS